MALRQQIFRFVYHQLLERPAQRCSFEQLLQALKTQGSNLAVRLAQLPDTPEHREQLRHIIGIERWGQWRLRNLLGKPFVGDEYNGYRPGAATTWRELQTTFVERLAASLAIARALQHQGIAKTATVQHNDAGSVSVGGWLHKIVQPAGSESQGMRYMR